MFLLGFFSRHTTERGLLVGVAVGFVVIWYVATRTDIAWPWYCAIGGAVNIAVSWTASLLLDGRQAEYSPYTVKGQKKQFAEDGRPEMDNGWFVIPGRVDRVSWYLLGLFAATLAFLYLFNALI
jgi:SSS family solute:Na+ symporter